jgi:hypothetical protein
VRLLPTACPELNPLEGLWREIKGKRSVNHVWNGVYASAMIPAAA